MDQELKSKINDIRKRIKDKKAQSIALGERLFTHMPNVKVSVDG